MTKMVVDSNYLQDPALRDYLAASPENVAVLTDYAAMEAYKGDTLNSVFKSMGILAEYPRQVIVLKGTQILRGLVGRAAASQKSLIDQAQTREFPEYCRDLMATKRGDLSFQNDLLEHGRAANAHMDGVLIDMPTLSSGIKSVLATYTAAELRRLRERELRSSELRKKLVQNVCGLADQLFEDHLTRAKRPSGARKRDAFLFRYALCTYALIINGSGGTVKANPEKLRNDMVDVNFATIATYFDGLLTEDRRAAETYDYAKFLLREIFALPPWRLRVLIAASQRLRALRSLLASRTSRGGLS